MGETGTLPVPAGGYVNRWLLSGIEEEPCVLGQSVSGGGVNRWLLDGAAINEQEGRRLAVERRRRQGAPPYREAPPMRTVHVPFDNPRIERSLFCFSPTLLRGWAKTRLRLAEPCRFRLASCGGAALYLDGKNLFDFTPFTRNVPACREFSINSFGPDQELCVFFDDIAERDTLYFFELKLLSGSLAIVLPECAETAAAEAMFLGAYIAADSFCEGPVQLCMENPFNRALTLRVSTGSEKFREWGGTREFSVDLPPFAKEARIAGAGELHTGYHHCDITLALQDAVLSRRFGFEVYRKNPPPLAALGERKARALELIRREAADDAAKALALLAGASGPADSRIEAIVKNTLAFAAARNDCSDFQLAPLLRIWRDYRERFPAAVQAAFQETILGFRYWHDEPGNDAMWFYSENHALMFHFCAFAAGSLFPAEVFGNSGLSGGKLRDKAAALLEGWFARFFAEGFTEWNSAAYIPVNVSGLAYLYEWDAGGSLGQKARRALDGICALLACFGSRGFMACSCGRSYEKELFADRCNEASFLSEVLWGAGHCGSQGMGIAPLCLSGYAPPPRLEPLVSLPSFARVTCRITQGLEGYADLYTYKAGGFMLSTAVNFRSGKRGYQEQICQLHLGPSRNVFVNHPGEFSTAGLGRPSYWAGNGILPRAFQHQGIAVLEFNIPDDHDIDFTHARIPRAGFQYSIEGNRLFFSCGGAFGLIYARNGLALTTTGINAGQELKSPGRHNVWVLRAAPAGDFAGFEWFKNAMRSIEIDIQEDCMTLNDPEYGAVSIGDTLSVNSREEEYTGFGVQGRYDMEAHLEGLAEKTAQRMMRLEKGQTREQYPLSLIDMDTWEWPQGVGLLGLVRLQRRTRDAGLLDYVHAWYAARFREGLPEKNVNTMAPMLALTELHAAAPRPEYLALIRENAEWVMKDLLRCGPGLFQHMITGDRNDGQILIDTLFMTCLFLASAGRLLEKPEYIEESNRQFLLHIEHLFDRKAGLFFHGYDFNERHHYGAVHWGRGNGWYTCCAADYLELANPPQAVRETIAETLRLQCAALAPLQDSTGMWHTVLDNSASYAETSATAAIAYGMFRGADAGILDASFYRRAWKALDAVCAHITGDGAVEGVSYGTPVGRDEQFYLDIPCCPMTYGQALTLLALCRAMQGSQGSIMPD